MQTKLIYFIRNAENEDTVNNESQQILTQKGKDHALATARRFPKKNGCPDIIISSTSQITRATAEVVAYELGLKIEYSDYNQPVENFIYSKERAKKLLSHLTERREKRLIVVTEGNFLKMIISYIIYGEKLTTSEYDDLRYIDPTNNAGMVICSYTTYWIQNPKWKLIFWNDLE